MRKLDWNKVGRMLWIDMTMRRKRILMLCLIVMGATFALLTYGVFAGSTFGSAPSDVQEMLPYDMDTLRISSIVGNSEFALFIASLVVFTGIFTTIEKQSDEIRYLMLPASTLEKWVSRVAYVVIVGHVLVELSYFVGLLAWCGVASLLGSDLPSVVLSMIFHPLDMVNAMGMKLTWTIFLSGYAASFLIYSFYILCGTYYRHNPWLYALLWGIGVYVFLVIALVVAIFVAVFNGWWNPESMFGAGKFSFDFTPFEPWALILGVVSVLLGVFFLWLSYRRFSVRQLEKKQVFIRKG